MSGACSTYGRDENYIQFFFVEKPEGKRPSWRHRRGWEDNIRMDLREIGLKGVDWIHLAQDRDRWRAVVNTVMNLRVPQMADNFLTSWVRTLFRGVSMLIHIVSTFWVERIAACHWVKNAEHHYQIFLLLLLLHFLHLSSASSSSHSPNTSDQSKYFSPAIVFFLANIQSEYFFPTSEHERNKTTFSLSNIKFFCLHVSFHSLCLLLRDYLNSPVGPYLFLYYNVGLDVNRRHFTCICQHIDLIRNFLVVLSSREKS